MGRDIFETDIGTQLAQVLKAGDVVILDNLSCHKSERAVQVIQAKGVLMLFLPPYTPNLNPIEKNSKHISGPLPPEPLTTSGKRSEASAHSSRHKNAQTTSTPPDMDSIDRPVL